MERPRPKGNNSDAFNRSMSMRTGDGSEPKVNVFKRQTSLTPSDLPSIQEARDHNSFKNTSRMRFCFEY
jgi:hypothetical protein